MRYGIICAALLIPNIGATDQISEASYIMPTKRYDHAILGDDVEWGGLRLVTTSGRRLTITLPETRVFEDLAPRLADIDADGTPEVVVVETDIARGARLAVYDELGFVAATPYIGRTHRWLSPVGVADLDGDGQVEIAYIDRPHLSKTLRIWRFGSGPDLLHVADLAGVTNHKIGWDYIIGGLRDCDNGIEMLVADANWKSIQAITFDETFHMRDLNLLPTSENMAAAMECG